MVPSIVLSLAACTAGSDPGDGEVPLIEAALAATCPAPPVRTVDGPPRDLHRVTLIDAGRCNDGSPPVMFVRPASDPAHAEDWVVHLQGGGACFDGRDCERRWCAEPGRMSSRYAPPTKAGDGLLSPLPSNPLSGFHAIEVPYCTSDLWLGTAGATVIEGPPAFQLYFEGADVVAGVVAALQAGVTSDDGLVTLPPLQAGRVVLSGSSAGAIGATQHADRVAGLLEGSDLRVLIDSGIQPPPSLLPAPYDAAGVDWFDTLWTDTWDGLWGVQVDESCLADAADPHTCYDLDHVQREALSVPSLVHHDLVDPTMHGVFEAQAGVPLDVYAAAGEAMLRRYPLAGVAVHGSACGLHTAVGKSDTWLGLAVADAEAGGPARSLAELAVAWLEGQDDVAVDDPEGSGSVCP